MTFVSDYLKRKKKYFSTFRRSISREIFQMYDPNYYTSVPAIATSIVTLLLRIYVLLFVPIPI